MKLRVRVKSTGFWQDRLYFDARDTRRTRYAAPLGTPDEFYLDERGFRYDEEGAILVDENYRPILPRWVEAVEEVPKLDPEKVPCQVIERAEITKREKRRKAQMAVADPEPEDKPGQVNIPEHIQKKRGPGRPRKNDTAVL